MPVTVTLHVFSGRPYPTWVISDQDFAALEERITALERPTLSKPPGIAGMLGYRGFSLQRPAAGGAQPLDLYIHEGIVDRGPHEVNYVDESRELEQQLLRGAPQDLDSAAREHVTAEIQRGALTAAPGAPTALPWPWPWPWPWPPHVCPPSHAADAPAYNPALWNIPSVQPFNNCYNYANNRITNTFAQPGRAHGKMYTALTCAAVEPAAVADGLHAVPNFTATLPAGQGWYVALVIWPNSDYHWYRQDNVGCWSHKPGGTAARNVDNAGNRITDPRTANRGPYTQFCTFMVTTHAVVIN
jgi:hypothetical protein